MYTELRGKKLLVLGGMKVSCEIVRKAQEMGVYVAVTDYNAPEKSPAKEIADESFMVSTTDVNAIVDLIKSERFDGVLTGFVDLLLPYYAEICRKAGLPSLATKEQYEVFIEKKRYKALLKAYDIPVPEEYILHDVTSEQLSTISFPVIVKPADSSGARGVTVCDKREELEAAYLEALRFSNTRSIIVEEFLTGVEVTAFWMMQDGEAYFLGLGNRHVENNQGPDVIPLPVGYTFPSIYTKKYSEEIAPKMVQMLKDSGIRNGLLFLQCIVDDGVPKAYDLGLRLTGSLEYHIFQKTCGYNPMEMLIRFALTGSEGEMIRDKVDPHLNGRYGWNISFLVKPGTIAKVIGYEEIKVIPGVIDVIMAHEVGEVIELSDRGLLRQICCRVLGHSDTVDEMRDAIDRVTSTFEVLDENGRSLLLPVFDVDKYRNSIV